MKNRKIKKLIRTATSFVTVLAMNAVIIFSHNPVLAYVELTEEEINNKINQITQENEQKRNEIESIEGDISDNKSEQDKIASLLNDQKGLVDYYNNLAYYKNEDIKELEGKIADKEKDIEKLNGQISVAEQNIADKETENAENLEKFAQIVRAMYTSGGADSFGVLAGSTDFYQLMVGTEVMGNISEKNQEFMNKLKADIKQLEADKNTLETDKANLLIEKQKLEDDKIELDSEKQELDGLLDDAKSEEERYQNDYNKYQTILDDLEYKQDNLEYEISLGEDEIEAFEEQLKELIIQQTKPGTDLQDAEWIWPCPGFSYITTYFGWDSWLSRWHKGIDIGDAGINCTPIHASKGGTVIIAEDWYIPGYSYGKYVVVDHGGGYTSTYAHMTDVYAYVGQQVQQGDVLGTVGNTGYSFGPHLHFEIRYNGEPEDPFWYVDFG